jgi:hypothetical protein
MPFSFSPLFIDVLPLSLLIRLRNFSRNVITLTIFLDHFHPPPCLLPNAYIFPSKGFFHMDAKTNRTPTMINRQSVTKCIIHTTLLR